MKYIYILLLSISLSYGYGLDIPEKRTYIDLGKEGSTYPILEKNFIEELKEGASEVQKTLNKKYVKEKIIKSVINQANANTSLGYCEEPHKKVELNEYIVPVNIYNPAGRLYKKKGDKIIINNDKPIDLCFINVKSLKDAKKQIEYFDNIVKKVSGNSAECVYLVSGINVLQLDKIYYPRQFYPAKKNYEKNFNILCYPTYIHLILDKRYRFEIPYKEVRGEK